MSRVRESDFEVTEQHLRHAFDYLAKGADAFDVIVNGIEDEIQLSLPDGGIKRRQPPAQNVGHYSPPHPRQSIANSLAREKQPSVASARLVTASG